MIHHKKLKEVIPAWIFFPLYWHCEPKTKWTEAKEFVGKSLKKSLEQHLESHGLSNHVITEPNNYDTASMYGRNIDSGQSLGQGGTSRGIVQVLKTVLKTNEKI